MPVSPLWPVTTFICPVSAFSEDRMGDHGCSDGVVGEIQLDPGCLRRVCKCVFKSVMA